MDQSQGGNPFGRLIEFARPHKTGYIVSVVLAVLGVAFGIVPYFATARMTIELLSGNPGFIILHGVVSDFRRLLCPKSNIDGDFHEGIP